jgi:hypothetical protein
MVKSEWNMISKNSIKDLEVLACYEIIECSATDLWITWILKQWSKNSPDKSRMETLLSNSWIFASGGINTFILKKLF